VNRKITMGPKYWIILDGKWLVCNVADLCPLCHDKLESQVGGTNHRLRFLDNNGWGWYERLPEDDTLTRIIWYDRRNHTAWMFKGFLKGFRNGHHWTKEIT
jgi:hypothetical protein